MVKFGTNPIAWANDDDRSIGANIPTEQILREAGLEIGFDGIENGHRWPEDPEELRCLLEKYDLRFISGWHSLNVLANSIDEEKKAIQPHLDKLKHNSCDVCIVCETSNSIHGNPDIPLSRRPVLTGSEMIGFAAGVEEIAKHCAEQGIKLVYHHHMGTVVQSPEDIVAFMDASGPNTYLLFDTGHCYFGGGDPETVLRKHVSRVGHFHAKNVRQIIREVVERDDLSFLQGVRQGVFTVPGDPAGAVDFVPLLKLLATGGYDSWLVIEAEQNPETHNPLEYQTLGLKSLKDAASVSGLAA